MQELFWKLFAVVKYNFKEIAFAPLNKNKECDKSGNNYEKRIETKRSFCKADFYADGKIIEFDGDYWHSELMCNPKREKERDEELIEQGFDILHIKENVYLKDKQKTVNECLKFLGVNLG